MRYSSDLGQDLDVVVEEHERNERVDSDNEVDVVNTDSERTSRLQLVQPVYQKKLFIKARIVNSIDTAEDEPNYNMWKEPLVERVLESKVDDMAFQFTNKKLPLRGKTRRQNVIKPPVGVRDSAKHATTPLQLSSFSLSRSIWKRW